MPIFPNLNNSDELKALFYRLFVVIFICIGLSFLSEAFLTVNNLLNVLRQASLLFLMASGLTLVILTAGIDLSVGANVGMSACLAGTVLLATGSTTLGFLTGICCGALIGLANGLLVTLLRLPSFIATYGMLWILHGITYYFMAGATINGFSKSFRMIGSGYWFGIPVPIYMMLFFLISGSIFLRYTIFGQQIYALGANPVTARLSGVPVTRRLLLVYILSGITAGLASLVFLARLNSAEGDIGEALTLPAIAAADGALTNALRGLLAVAEAYPDLKASSNFLQLQEELATTENKVSFSRQFYNETVRSLNTAVKTIPTSFFVGLAKVGEREFYEVDDPSARNVPNVKF